MAKRDVDSIGFCAYLANAFGVEAYAFSRTVKFKDEKGPRVVQYVQAEGANSSTMGFIKKMANYTLIKQPQFKIIADNADAAQLSLPPLEGKSFRNLKITPAAAKVRVMLVERSGALKKEEAQQTVPDLRDARPWVNASGEIVPDHLAAYAAGFLCGDGCADERGVIALAQSYEAFLIVLGEDLDKTFGTGFGKPVEQPKPEHSVKQPFQSRSPKSKNATLAREMCKFIPAGCFEAKRARLQAIFA